MDRFRLAMLPLVLALSFAASGANAQSTGAKPAAPAAGSSAKAAPSAGTASSTGAGAGSCRLQIAGNDLMQFDKKELRVASSCKEFEVVLTHSGKLPLAAMGHNWVLTRTADAQAVSNAGIAAGLKANHVPQGDKRVIAATKLLGGGEKTSIKVPMTGLQKGGDYTYFCSFPGHYAIMKGKLVVE